jgi:alanine dehydrogenase
MRFDQIVVVKETLHNEKRVALTPKVVAQLTDKGYRVWIEEMLGFLFPFVADNHIATWQQLGLTTLSFDLFKSISINDQKNAQAAMSRIAGRLAFHDAVKLYQGEKPLNLVVIGAGAAGISAAKEAKNHKIPVQLLGRKESLREESSFGLRCRL